MRTRRVAQGSAEAWSEARQQDPCALRYCASMAGARRRARRRGRGRAGHATPILERRKPGRDSSARSVQRSIRVVDRDDVHARRGGQDQPQGHAQPVATCCDREGSLRHRSTSVPARGGPNALHSPSQPARHGARLPRGTIAPRPTRLSRTRRHANDPAMVTSTTTSTADPAHNERFRSRRGDRTPANRYARCWLDPRRPSRG